MGDDLLDLLLEPQLEEPVRLVQDQGGHVVQVHAAGVDKVVDHSVWRGDHDLRPVAQRHGLLVHAEPANHKGQRDVFAEDGELRDRERERERGGGTGRVAALRLKSFIKIKLKGTKPSKINVKGTLSLNWVLRDIFIF